MSNRLMYSPKNAIRCSPLRSFKSDIAAFRFGCWFAASLGNQKAAQWCEENGIPVTRAASEGINSAGGSLVPGEFLTLLYSVLELRGAIRATAEVVPIGRDVATATKVLTGLTAYFVGEGDRAHAIATGAVCAQFRRQEIGHLHHRFLRIGGGRSDRHRRLTDDACGAGLRLQGGR